MRARKQEENVGNRLNLVELWWCWLVRTRGIRGADWGGGGRGDDSGELGDTDRLWGTQRVGGKWSTKWCTCGGMVAVLTVVDRENG